jgi:hypothetical protein
MKNKRLMECDKMKNKRLVECFFQSWEQAVAVDQNTSTKYEGCDEIEATL